MRHACGFNIDHGYLEGICRGFKNGLLTEKEYENLGACVSLDDIKVHLQATDYSSFLANEPSPIQVKTLDRKCSEKLFVEFTYMRNHSYEPLSTFLDYMW